MARKRATCGNCRKGPPRFGGLCPDCFADAAVRARFATPKPAAGADGEDVAVVVRRPRRKRRVLPDPTPHQPGTAAKVEELRRRASAGMELFHPADARRDDAAVLGRMVHHAERLAAYRNEEEEY